MATGPLGDPNNSANQRGIPEFQVAKAGGPPAAPDLSGVQNVVNDMASAFVKLSDTMASILERMEGVRSSAEGVGRTVKDVANQQDRMVGLLKQSASLNKEFTASLKNQKLSWGEIQQQAKRVLDFNKQLLAEGKLNIAQANSLKASIKGISNVFDAASKGAQTFGKNMKADTDAVKNFSKAMDDASRSSGQLVNNLGRVAQSRIERQVNQLSKAYRDAGNSNKLLNFMEDQYAKKAAARELQAARTAQSAETRAQHLERMKAVIPKVAQKYMGFDMPRKANGELDYAAAAKMKPQSAAMQEKVGALPYAKWAKAAAYNQGEGVMGGLDVGLRTYAMRAQARAATGGAEGAPGWFARQAIKGQEAAGAGGSVAGGMMEGGIGAGLGMAAMGYGVFKVLEKFIDTRAQVNQGVEKGMGAALYAPGVSGTSALKNVRENLSANLFNAFGQNLDRNLAIAQVMQEQGIDLTELSKGNVRGKALPSGGQPADTEGFLGGVFGEFQRNAMVAGRGAGLTDQQSVTRMTKMIHEMRQTFEATHDFLSNVNVQARAAGISTTKYLGIIDNLTDQFDKMNKSFAESVSLIQSLGAAGTNTAEEISDMSKALTGAGENKTIEQSAAGFAFMSPSQRKSLTASVQKSIDEADAKLTQAMGAANGGKGMTTGLNLNDPTDLMMLQSELAGSNMAPEQKKNIKEAAERKRAALMQMQGIAVPGTQGQEARAAFGINEFGAGAEVMQGIQTSNLVEGLKAANTNFEELLHNPSMDITAAVAATTPLGYKATDYQDALKAIVSLGTGLAPSRVAEVKGMAPGDKDKRLREFFKYGQKMKVFSKDEAYDEGKMMKTLDDNVAMSKIIAEEIATHPERNQDALHQEMKKGQEEDQKAQIKSVAMQTRTTADIYANAFEKFFTMLEKPISAILNLMSHAPKSATPEAKAAFNALTKNIEVAEQALGEKALAGDKAAQDTLSSIQAMEEKMRTDPDAVTADELADALKKVHDNSDKVVAEQTDKMSDVLSKLAPTKSAAQLAKEQPGLSQEAIESQYVRNVLSASGGGEQTSDDKIYLNQRLDQKIIDAYNRMAQDAGLKTRIEAGEGGTQYINITQNSTQQVALMNTHGLYPNLKANEQTSGASGGPISESALTGKGERAH
jgi:hypothetical protein